MCESSKVEVGAVEDSTVEECSISEESAIQEFVNEIVIGRVSFGNVRETKELTDIFEIIDNSLCHICKVKISITNSRIVSLS